ncbi:predicted protein [Botrytis cinerea T4]|uniref:Uncharacterized protein n=1 Tax=Botryotinia fuckeliana (strain T4) TaxID=999810 RepID=G2YHQ5_BOTF4|nr:predicted protein [Botrytis cinerea T4]
MISVYLSLRPQAGANTVTIGKGSKAVVEVREGYVGNSEAKFKHVFYLNVWTLMDEAR